VPSQYKRPKKKNSPDKQERKKDCFKLLPWIAKRRGMNPINARYCKLKKG